MARAPPAPPRPAAGPASQRPGAAAGGAPAPPAPKRKGRAGWASRPAALIGWRPRALGAPPLLNSGGVRPGAPLARPGARRAAHAAKPAVTTGARWRLVLQKIQNYALKQRVKKMKVIKKPGGLSLRCVSGSPGSHMRGGGEERPTSSRPECRDPASQGILQLLLSKANTVLMDNGFGWMQRFSVVVRGCGTCPSALCHVCCHLPRGCDAGNWTHTSAIKIGSLSRQLHLTLPLCVTEKYMPSRQNSESQSIHCSFLCSNKEGSNLPQKWLHAATWTYFGVHGILEEQYPLHRKTRWRHQPPGPTPVPR